MLLFAFEGKTTNLTIGKFFFLEICSYKHLSSKHYSNALIDLFSAPEKSIFLHKERLMTTIYFRHYSKQIPSVDREYTKTFKKCLNE
jgi:hypothetical protein